MTDTEHLIRKALDAFDVANGDGDLVDWRDAALFVPQLVTALERACAAAAVEGSSEPGHREADSSGKWSAEDRREAEAEARRRWGGFVDRREHAKWARSNINSFLLGAEWWKTAHAAPSQSERKGADLASEIEQHQPITICECDGVHEDGGCRESRSACDFCAEQWPCLVDRLAYRLRRPSANRAELMDAFEGHYLMPEDDPEYDREKFLAALEAVAARATSAVTGGLEQQIAEAVSAERKAIASALTHEGDRMEGEATQSGYYAAAHVVRQRERDALAVAPLIEER